MRATLSVNIRCVLSRAPPREEGHDVKSINDHHSPGSDHQERLASDGHGEHIPEERAGSILKFSPFLGLSSAADLEGPLEDWPASWAEWRMAALLPDPSITMNFTKHTAWPCCRERKGHRSAMVERVSGEEHPQTTNI